MTSMIRFKQIGDFEKTNRYLKKLGNGDYLKGLNRFGEMGVKALSEATPKDSGETASSWSYRIIKNERSVIIEWDNSHLNDGVNVAILIQYGHGTGTGGYVSGIDYINPALKPVFDKIANDAWEEVTRNA